MSDTVKLIIEIPKEDYKKLVNPYQHNEIWCERLKRMVMNGIPLDDVKAEIEKKCDRINSIASVLSYSQHREIQELLCEILDNIGKGSEE